VFAQEVELQHRANAQRQAELDAAELKAPNADSTASGESRQQQRATNVKESSHLRVSRLAKKAKSASAIKS
jgi:hypothetical protein